MSCPKRLVLFVNAQNMYRGARRAFFPDSTSYVDGNFNPVQLGQLIASRPIDGATRVLHQVRVYTGRPERTLQPESYAANLRQCAQWENWGAKVVARPLRYPHDWPDTKAQEKGIDVALAIDFIALAIDGEYDAGVIASTDTDLRPALEFVLERYKGIRRVEVAAWRSSLRRVRLTVPGAEVWCHWLYRTDYDNIADGTNYTVP
ncbi:MAG: NYN domain-containing protein [Anaerolineae bacterium]